LSERSEAEGFGPGRVEQSSFGLCERDKLQNWIPACAGMTIPRLPAFRVPRTGLLYGGTTYRTLCMNPTKPPILNLDDVQCVPLEKLMPKPPAPHILEKFQASMGFIGQPLGAQKLGYNLTVIAPGKPAFPFHNHRVNEEMFFIVEGRGELRLGGERHPVRRGDVIACPPGGPETAHQLVNTGDTPMKVLAVSTKLTPEICDYPDSGKFAIRGDFGAGADGKPQQVSYIGRLGQTLDYYDGE
jgi:uncharacterized cupin superfamily protein